jgi:arginyl-tRNA synthetase
MSDNASEQGLREALLAVVEGLTGGADRVDRPADDGDRVNRPVSFERPPRAELGDYSTNAALVLAPVAKASPRELAEALGRALERRLGGGLERYEVAGPGFLNLHLSDGWHGAALAGVLAAGARHGAGGAERGERIVVEFVSANPTGPMHVGHGRNAAYGDALARVLALHGHEVWREFYVNDAGTQVLKLGESIAALAAGRPVPEDGYRGAYVEGLLAGMTDAASRSPAELGQEAVSLMIGEIERTLHGFRVEGFDHWQRESALHCPRSELKGAGGEPVSAVEHALELLERQGHTYRKDGALWLRSSAFGDDKDRVLVRSSGEHTYFASDIAYHQDKRERGFDRQIDVWGADHHGYMARMCAAYEALGGDPGQLEMLIMQLVHLVRRGERAQMSKRSGEFVTLEGLVAEIGVDAARWFLLSRSHDTTIDLDLDLAREQSNENPVYYVQYAHARIASMLQKAGARRVGEALEAVSRLACGGPCSAPAGASGGAPPASGEGVAPAEMPLHPAERALVKKLLAFPGELREAAERRAPHRMAAYALELAQQFTAFYRDCRVLGAETPAVESLRIGLSVAAQRTIAGSLDLLGVGAPEQM